MILNREQLEEKSKTHEDVWAYQFKVGNSKKGRRYSHLPPTRGQIVKNGGHYFYFIPYGKKGKLLESKKRATFTQTIIVETEKEAIDNYNLLIKKRIKECENQIDELKGLLK